MKRISITTFQLIATLYLLTCLQSTTAHAAGDNRRLLKLGDSRLDVFNALGAPERDSRPTSFIFWDNTDSYSVNSVLNPFSRTCHLYLHFKEDKLSAIKLEIPFTNPYPLSYRDNNFQQQKSFEELNIEIQPHFSQERTFLILYDEKWSKINLRDSRYFDFVLSNQ